MDREGHRVSFPRPQQDVGGLEVRRYLLPFGPVQRSGRGFVKASDRVWVHLVDHRGELANPFLSLREAVGEGPMWAWLGSEHLNPHAEHRDWFGTAIREGHFEVGVSDIYASSPTKLAPALVWLRQGDLLVESEVEELRLYRPQRESQATVADYRHGATSSRLDRTAGGGRGVIRGKRHERQGSSRENHADPADQSPTDSRLRTVERLDHQQQGGGGEQDGGQEMPTGQVAVGCQEHRGEHAYARC